MRLSERFFAFTYVVSFLFAFGIAELAHLFAAFCRSQNIPCYAVDGTLYDRSNENHTWNRVYHNGSWWDMDLTNDTLVTKDGRKLYGFRELENITSPDKDYSITKIY